MTVAHENAIRRFIRATCAVLFLRYLLLFLTLYGFVWGTTVLVLRVAVGADRLHLLWGLAGVVPVSVAAAYLAWRRAPGPGVVRALLDGHSRAGGLLMAADEVDLGGWAGTLPPTSEPRLTWHGRNSALHFAAAAAFVAMAFAVPHWVVQMETRSPLDIHREVAELAQQIEVLKEEEILKEQEAEELAEKLETVETDAAGEDPATTWEALDHLGDLVEKSADEAAEQALKDAQEMTDLETLTEAVLRDAAELTPEQRTDAMRELAEMAERTAKECQGMNDVLDDALRQAIENGKLTTEQLKKLANALRQCQGGLRECLGRLVDAELIDAELLEQLARLSEREGAPCEGDGDLAAFLCAHEGEMNMGEMLEAYLRGLPGRGGIDRGRADAPMTWTDGSSEEDTKFEKQVLPPSAVADLKKSLLAGVSTGAPHADKPESSTGGALTDAAAGGGSARTRVILPRHRGTVKRYFERSKSSAGTPPKQGSATP